MKEIEVRSIIENTNEMKDRLKDTGFILKDSFMQHDIMLDKEDASFFKSGSKIRIRIEKDKAELTYKGKMADRQDVSERIETNIPINVDNIDNYIQVFTAMGYPLCFQIKKEREVWEHDGIKVTLDNWPIIGYLAEIEGEEEKIKRYADIISPNTIFKNYRLKELFENKMKQTGKDFSQLKQDYLSKTGFDLGNIELILQ